jgi:hypothetical protein
VVETPEQQAVRNIETRQAKTKAGKGSQADGGITPAAEGSPEPTPAKAEMPTLTDEQKDAMKSLKWGPDQLQALGQREFLRMVNHQAKIRSDYEKLKAEKAQAPTPPADNGQEGEDWDNTADAAEMDMSFGGVFKPREAAFFKTLHQNAAEAGALKESFTNHTARLAQQELDGFLTAPEMGAFAHIYGQGDGVDLPESSDQAKARDELDAQADAIQESWEGRTGRPMSRRAALRKAHLFLHPQAVEQQVREEVARSIRHNSAGNTSFGSGNPGQGNTQGLTSEQAAIERWKIRNPGKDPYRDS